MIYHVKVSKIDGAKNRITLDLSAKAFNNLIMSIKGKDLYIDVPNLKDITPQQRKAVYAMFDDMGKHLGYSKEEIKNILKIKYTGATGNKPFSLSNMGREEATEFIHFCIDICLAMNIPIQLSTYQSIDKDDYVIKQLLLHRQCIIDGKRADIHHLDTVGMGNNRNKIDNSQKELLPLCRTHHSEYHTIGHDEFMHKYHLTHGVKLSKEELKKINIHA